MDQSGWSASFSPPVCPFPELLLCGLSLLRDRLVLAVLLPGLGGDLLVLAVPDFLAGLGQRVQGGSMANA